MEVAAPIVKPDIAPTREIVGETGKDPLNRSAEERPPNVVLILADDLGWNDITLNGGVANGTVPTPHIDSIAQQGVNFLNGYAANATCAPSRAAMLSGRYPTRFGFEFTPVPPGMMQMASLGAQKIHPNRPRLTSASQRCLRYSSAACCTVGLKMRLPELRLALIAKNSFSARSTAVSKCLVFSVLRTYLLSSLIHMRRCQYPPLCWVLTISAFPP